ncbi:hypothetical protein NFI96_003947 [Prochilodus magdalenae]|nr:hypothetical protein NFI96_003947 [Prochilodus magdalenae]
MQVTLGLISVIFPKVLALQCYQCIPGQNGACTDTEIDCPDQCASGTVLVSVGVQQHKLSAKNCTAAEECINGSLNLGLVKATINTKCCNTDLCNNQTVPVLPFGAPNGKKCYTCTNNECTGTVNCEGDEDRCISAIALRCYQCTSNGSKTCTNTQTDCPDQCGSTTTLTHVGGKQQELVVKGCAAAEECVNGSLNLGTLKTTINTKCCNTDLCNNQTLPALPFGSTNRKKCYTCTKNDCTRTLNCEGDEDRCVSAIDDILQLLESSNPTTCPLDPIPSPLLRSISLDLLPFISSLINSSLSSGCVPQAFKTARVVPILKKPSLDSSDVSSYRPVSLLPFLSKILECAVYNQLSFFLSQNQLQDINQSRFKPAHSIETALIAVTERLHAARSAKLSSVLILLDLSAAFDTVNHKILLSVLTNLGITGTAWKWFKSYLEDRHYQVTWNGFSSAPCRLSTGVPQGSVLGPLLFSLHTLSLGKVITSHGFSYHCYADDKQLMLSFPSSDTQVCNCISACLTDISSWMTAHHLKLSPSKTELLFIPSTTGPHCDLAISFGNLLITPTENARSLGVILDGQLSFSAHIANLTRSCRFLLYNIRRIRPFLSQEATQLLVQSLVISRLDYCNSLLAGLPLRAIRPLQLVQNAPYLMAMVKSRAVPRALRALSTARLEPPSHWASEQRSLSRSSNAD